MKFKTNYLYKGLPAKFDILDQAFTQIKSGVQLSKFDMSNDNNIKDVLESVYKAGIKRGKNKSI